MNLGVFAYWGFLHIPPKMYKVNFDLFRRVLGGKFWLFGVFYAYV
jgi:hypothetical protein